MEYVRLSTVASVMNLNHAWLRNLIYQSVVDDEREKSVKGSPHIMHVRQIVQALVALKMRRAGIGYNAIRIAIDDFEIDRRKTHVASISSGVDVVLRKAVLVLKAQNILMIANEVEYGMQQQELAA